MRGREIVFQQQFRVADRWFDQGSQGLGGGPQLAIFGRGRLASISRGRIRGQRSGVLSGRSEIGLGGAQSVLSWVDDSEANR